MNEETVFAEARSKPYPAERDEFLKQVCRDDAELRARVEALLEADKAHDSLLDEPLVPQDETAELPATFEKPGDQIGDYKLLQQIGEGGFGVVFMAEQQRPVVRRVALKIIKPGMDSREVIARFEAERQALAMMDHPNIAKVLGAGATSRGRPYFVMELVRGIRITQFCDDQQLTPKERLELFIPVCHAIQHAHQKGIIHRDIKPSNVLVSLYDGRPVPKVIDFGVAKAIQQRLTEKTMFTQFGQVIGTLEYMSPEQAEMNELDIDTRADIYSLGAVLYELLTGTPPFERKRLRSGAFDQVLRIIREEEPPRPSLRLSTSENLPTISAQRKMEPARLSRLVRGELDWIVMKALDKQRSRRYETANGLAMDIGRHLYNEAILARPPSTAYRLRKAFQRNKVAFTTAAIVAMALLTGITVSTWQAIEARRARDAGQVERLAALTQRNNAQAALKEAQRARAAEKQERLRAVAGEATAQRLLYAANMTLIQRAWNDTNVELVRQLLEESADYADRGFEWYYWQRQMHQEAKTLRGHTSGIHTVAFSPDGRRIVTAADDSAKVWDALTGNELITLRGHTGPITSVAVSPDWQKFVTGSADQTAKVWDAANGEVLATLKGHGNTIHFVAFLGNSEQVVTTSQLDRTTRIWNATTGELISTIQGDSGSLSIGPVALSPDSQRIAMVSGIRDQTVKLHDIATGEVLLTLQGGHTASASVSSVAFSPDSHTIVTASGDGVFKVWDAVSGQELVNFTSQAPAWVIAFSADGQCLVTGGLEKTALIWDAVSGKQLATLPGHSGQVRFAAFSQDGQRLLTCGGQEIKVWDVATAKELHVLKGQIGSIYSAAFSPDGRRIVSGSDDQTAKVWDLTSNNEVRIVPDFGKETVYRLSTDGQRIVASRFQPMAKTWMAKIWDVTTGKELLTLDDNSGPIYTVAFSSDRKTIVTSGYRNPAKVWDATSGKELFTLRGHTDAILPVAISPNGQRIATASVDQTAKVWDAATGKELITLEGHTAPVWLVAFSPDGKKIVTGSHDHTAKIWDAATGKVLFTLKGHTGSIIELAFSPDGKKIVTGSADQSAKVWDVATGNELLTLKGHSAYVAWLAFSRDGQRIVTGSYDQTAKVWDAISGKELLTLQGYWGFSPPAIHPDGQRIVAVSEDRGKVTIWEAATPQQVAAWRQEDRLAAERLETVRREQAAAAERAQALAQAEDARAQAARAQDPGAIKRWLVLAPIPFEGKDGVAALDEEQLPQEAGLRPHADQRVNLGKTEAPWRAVQNKDYLLEFTILAKEVQPSAWPFVEYSLGYAVTYIHSETSHPNLVMKIGSDDQAKVYLNGREIHRNLYVRSYKADQDVVSNVELQAGLNVLVLKVVNEAMDWRGSIWLTDAAAQPVPGITVTLDPDSQPSNASGAR
jgi:WD40 repeat protein/serine/threonine protein kinase